MSQAPSSRWALNSFQSGKTFRHNSLITNTLQPEGCITYLQIMELINCVYKTKYSKYKSIKNMIKDRFQGKTKYLKKKLWKKTVERPGFNLKEPLFSKKKKTKKEAILPQACYRKKTAF